MNQSALQPSSQRSLPLASPEADDSAAQNDAPTTSASDASPLRDGASEPHNAQTANGGAQDGRKAEPSNGHRAPANPVVLEVEPDLMLGLISRSGLARIIEQVRATYTPKVFLAAEQLRDIEDAVAKELQAAASQSALRSLQITMVQDLGFAPGLLRRILSQRPAPDPGKPKRKANPKPSA